MQLTVVTILEPWLAFLSVTRGALHQAHIGRHPYKRDQAVGVRLTKVVKERQALDLDICLLRGLQGGGLQI